MLKFFFTLLAVAFLTVGILWQNGYVDLFALIDTVKKVKQAAIRQPIDIELPKKVISKPVMLSSIEPDRRVAEGANMPEDNPSSEPFKTIAKGTQGQGRGPHTGLKHDERQGTTMPEKRITPVTTASAISTSVKPKQGAANLLAAIKSESPPGNPQSYPYSLYVGSFRTAALAQRAVSIYRKKGLSPYWVKVVLSSGIWYRVYAGYFESRNQAEDFRQEKRLSKTTVKETPYANLIGTYASIDDLVEKIAILRDLGYSPYVIKDNDEKSRLYVGAFQPKRRAERTYQELEASGIMNRIVKR